MATADLAGVGTIALGRARVGRRDRGERRRSAGLREVVVVVSCALALLAASALSFTVTHQDAQTDARTTGANGGRAAAASMTAGGETGARGVPSSDVRFEAAGAAGVDGALYRGSTGSHGLSLYRDRFALSPGDGGGDIAFRFADGAAAPELVPADERADRRNYLLGADPDAWRTDVAGFGSVRYQGVWPGIDVVLYGRAGQSEFDVVVAPGADVSVARFVIDGARSVSVAPDGSLVVQTSTGELRQSAPVAFQVVDGVQREVVSRFVVDGKAVSFEVGAYDHELPLTIDPTIAYSTYLGTGGNDISEGVAVDSAGNVYVVGYAWAWSAPNKHNLGPGGNNDVFVAKLDPTGSTVLWTTFVGGAADDFGHAIAVDATGRAYLVGWTQSYKAGAVGNTDFPTTANAMQQAWGGGTRDAFLVRLDPTGSVLEYSSLVGGSGEDYLEGVAVQSGGYAVISGSTTSVDAPVGVGGAHASHSGAGVGCDRGVDFDPKDGFMLRIKTETPSIGRTYGTYFGGTCYDNLRRVALDGAGNIYLGGYTYSTDFPGGVDLGLGDSIAVKFAANPVPSTASALPVYSYLFGGGTDDIAWGVTVDSANQAVLTGKTGSGDFPVTSGPACSPNTDVFVARVNAAGTGLASAVCLGGNGVDQSSDIRADTSGGVWVTGNTSSTNLGVVDSITGQVAPTGGADTQAFVAHLATDNTVSTLSYLGGSGNEDYAYDPHSAVAVDSAGNVVIAGRTLSTDYPTTPGAYQGTATPDGNIEIGITKLNTATATVPGKPGTPTAVAGNASATVTWTAPASNGGSPITSYTVTSNPGSKTCTWSSGPLSCVVGGLTNGTSYTFTVTATNAIGTGAPSNASNSIIPTSATFPGAPGKPSVYAGDTSVLVYWTAPVSNGGSVITGYTVTASPGGATCAWPGGANPLSCTVLGLTNGTPYTFTVKAINAIGPGPASPASNAVTPPVNPPTITSAPPSGTSITVNFTPPATGPYSSFTATAHLLGEDPYVVAPQKQVSVSAAATSAILTGLTPGQSYRVRMQSVNGVSVSTFSVGQTVTLAGTTVPGAPTNVSATADRLTAAISWSAPLSNGGATIIGYTVSSSPAGPTCSWTSGPLTCSVSGLTAGVSYTFTVKATNSAGTGAGASAAAVTAWDGVGYRPVAPTRLLDSRTAVGGWNGKLAAGAPRTVTVTGGVVPAWATAVVMNVTATNGSAGSFVTAYPNGSAIPNASNLNFAANETIPNLVTVKVGTGGKVAFANAVGAVDLTADVVGYYDDGSWSHPGQPQFFNGITPTRVLDSRTALGGWNGKLAAGADRSLYLSGVVAPSPTAATLILNVTATNASAGSFLTVWQSGPKPNVSNLNFGPNQTIPNLVVVPLEPSSSIQFSNAVGSVDVVVDVVGFYSTDQGARFHPLNPTRVLDDRVGTGLSGPWGANQSRPLEVSGTNGISCSATGIVANVTATNATAGSFASVFPNGAAVPNASNLNFGPNQTIPNLVIVKTGTPDLPATCGAVSFYNKFGNVDLIADVVGYFSTY